MWPFHRHHWTAVQAEPMVVTKSGHTARGNYRAAGEAITQVVYRCTCGTIDSDLVPGTWTLDALNRTTS